MAHSPQIRDDIVAAQYRAWVYPQPVTDMAEAVAGGGYFDLSDPSLFRRKLWPRKIEPENLSILIAGCGTNQAACYALKNRSSPVVGIDISEPSLGHEAYLRQKHSLDNLELFRVSLDQVASLGRRFDLIVCTGVLHHLPDPDAGLRCLRDVLNPHGVMSLMVYGYYARFGVYMMQEAFRLLDLQQDATGVENVKSAIQTLPSWHHLNAYVKRAPDLSYDSGFVDTFLHRMDRAFTVAQVLQFAKQNNLKLQSWLDNLDYSISASIADAQNPLRRAVEALRPADQWHLVELVAQSLPCHRFLLCHPEKDEADYALDFTGSKWLDYIPSLRQPFTVSGKKDITRTAPADADSTGTSWSNFVRLLTRISPGTRRSRNGTSSVKREAFAIRRSWHTVELTTFEAALLEQVDGRRPIREILRTMSADWDDEQLLSAAGQFFRRMAEWDHFQYQIP
jgi:SAM-dependent methyltransferase